MDTRASLSGAPGDEYDALPDPFEGVDFDQIPELCDTAGQSSDYDQYFDDLDPSELDGVPHLGPLPSTGAASGPRPRSQLPPPAPPVSVPAQAASAANREAHTGEQTNGNPAPESQVQGSVASTQYEFDEIDETFLQEATVIEQAALGHERGNARPSSAAQHAASSRRQSVASLAASNRTSQRSSFKRKRSDVSSAPGTPSKRSKFSRTKSREAPVDPHASARKVLDGMEEELTCPICYELLVIAYSTNPCGHSCCGTCLLEWIKASRSKPPPNHEPKCPICRTKLQSSRPAIPNIAMDNLVQRYVSGAAEVGKVDWQPTGDRYQAFVARKEQSATLSAQFAQLQNAVPAAVDDDDDDDDDEFWGPPAQWAPVMIEDDESSGSEFGDGLSDEGA